jgi:hypothetical protein
VYKLRSNSLVTHAHNFLPFLCPFYLHVIMCLHLHSIDPDSSISKETG